MTATLENLRREAKDRLDAHTYEIVQWHFHETTGCPFWLQQKSELKFDPLKEVKCFEDLRKFPPFEDEWLRGGPVRRWVPKAFQDRPVYVFETGGTTGIPKSRIVIDDFRTDYELFSHTLPDQYFPPGANWLMLGPSGPRRLRLAVEHLCQYRGGICFCIDLDPRWVIKLIKKGWMEHLEEYKRHCIEQAVTILTAGHDIKCAFATPKLLEALAVAPRGTRHHDPGDRLDGHLLRRDRVHAAVDAVLHRGVLRRSPGRQRRVHDPDLRQHADGAGLQQAGHGGRRLQDHVLRAAAAGGDRSRRFR